MTEKPQGRASLAHTGNRVALSVVAGLLVGCIGNSGGGLDTGPHLALILIAAGLTYALLTLMQRR